MHWGDSQFHAGDIQDNVNLWVNVGDFHGVNVDILGFLKNVGIQFSKGFSKEFRFNGVGNPGVAFWYFDDQLSVNFWRIAQE